MKKLKELKQIIRDEIKEALKRKVVYRDGKRKVKWKSTKDGYKVKYDNGKPKEVRMSSKERKNRKRAAKKTARKTSTSKRKKAARKAKRSKKKRS